MKTLTQEFTVRMKFSYDEEKANSFDAGYTASNMAVRPNFDSKVRGVELLHVEIGALHMYDDDDNF